MFTVLAIVYAVLFVLSLVDTPVKAYVLPITLATLFLNSLGVI